MYSYENKFRKRIAIVTAVFIGIAIVAGVLITVISSESSENEYGTNYVNIKDLSQKVKNLPKEKRDSITTALYQVIALNSPDNTSIALIDDAVIRADSTWQNSGDEKGQVKGGFIVDIASIKQSYWVTYTSSSTDGDGYEAGYPITITCLEKEQLIYGEFDCKDVLSVENDGIDPIINSLPYEDLNFRISGYQPEDGKLEITVQFFISELDKNNGTEKAITRYKNLVADWFRKNGFTIEDYAIKYVY